MNVRLSRGRIEIEAKLHLPQYKRERMAEQANVAQAFFSKVSGSKPLRLRAAFAAARASPTSWASAILSANRQSAAG